MATAPLHQVAVADTRSIQCDGALRERTEEVVKLNEHVEQRVADQVGEMERMG
jgi:hypothetical protein